MRIPLSLTALALSSLLHGCFFYTPYAPTDFFFNGYRETDLGGDRFRVVYHHAGPVLALDLALLRAAELSLEPGYTCFEVTQMIGGGAYGGTHGWVIRTYRERPDGVGGHILDADIQRRVLRLKYQLPLP